MILLMQTVVASRRDGPYWGQLGCSGFIILSRDSQQIIAGKTKAFLNVGPQAFAHVESILDSAIVGQMPNPKLPNPNAQTMSDEGS